MKRSTLISPALWKAAVDRGEEPTSGIVKAFIADEIKQVEGEDRTLTFTISTAAVDRDNDTIDPAGWKLGNFKKSGGPVLFAHDYRSLPIARATHVRIEGTALKADAEFVPASVYPFAETVLQMLKGGFLKGCSVGFAPKKYSFNTERGGVDHMEQELLEFSVCPVGSNPEALLDAKSAGLDVEPLRQWAEATLAKLSPERTVKTGFGDVDLTPWMERTETREGVSRTWRMGWGKAEDEDEKPPAEEESAKADDVAPDADGNCPDGHELGEDGMCHLKAAAEVPPAQLALPADRATVRFVSPDLKSYNGFEQNGHTQPSTGTSAPTHVHDFSLWVYRDATGQIVFEGGQAYSVAQHSHAITADSLAAGKTTESDGHAHELPRAGVARSVAPVTADGDDIGLEAMEADDDVLAGLSLDEVRAAFREAVAHDVVNGMKRVLNGALGRID